MADARLPASSEACSLLRDLKPDDLLSMNSMSMMAVDRGHGRCSSLPSAAQRKRSVSGTDLCDVRSVGGEQIPMSRPFGAMDSGRRSLLLETDVQLCRLHHGRSLIRKILVCGCRRRWRTGHVLLGAEEIAFLEVQCSSGIFLLNFSYFFNGSTVATELMPMQLL